MIRPIDLEAEWQRVRDMMEILHVAEIVQEENMCDKDIVITIKFKDIISTPRPFTLGDLLRRAEIRRA